MKKHMKKFNHSIQKFLCLSALLFLGATTHVHAEELPDTQTETVTVDSRPDYVIYVNRALNCVTVKQQGEDGTLTSVKSIVCSCGREGHETPEGTFRTSNYYEWREMVDGTYGRYAVRFNGKILFHSAPYLSPSPDSLEWEEYNKLGQNASLGCVRMSVKDITWISDNCNPRTKVVVYSDAENAGDLGKPSVDKIAADSSCKSWDPTDTDSRNPWLTGAATATVEYVPFSGTIDEFNYTAYADQYPDIKAIYGYDKEALYDHYINCGINEGRIAVSY
ncbi:MAG: L,D-transpeptidase [Lachnospiraceae bacterium]|nr:L,D-transpeptidase [Lachnospiraceae bacterium]